MSQIENQLINHEEEIDLGELFTILWQRKWFIVLFVIMCAAGTYKYLTLIPDRFTSSILIMFKESNSNNDAMASIMSGGLSAADDTETELELLKSRRFAGQIVDNLHLTKHPEYILNNDKFSNTYNDTSIRRSHAIDVLSKNMKIDKTSGTNLVRVSYVSLSATHAATVANDIAKTFINFKQELLEGKNQDRSAWLSTKLLGVKISLEDAEAKIVEHQNENDFVDINSAIAIEKSKMAQMTKEKLTLSSNINELELLKEQVTRYEKSPEELANLPGFSTSATIMASKNEFNNRQLEFAQVKLRYGTKHPAFKKAKQSLEDAKVKVVLDFKDHVNMLDKKFSLWQSKLLSVDKQLHISNQRLKRLGAIEFDYQKLRREFDANLQLYENLVKKLKESNMMQDLANASNVLLVEKAEVATKADNKKKPLIMALCILLSGFIAMTFVLIQAFLANKIIQFRKVVRQFDTKLVGIIPKIKVTKNKDKPLYALDMNKHEQFFEALRTTRTNILLDNKLAAQKVIAVTSITPNDGKSTLSIQLAASFSELEKVILIDGDLRFPSIGNTLCQDVNRPGLTNLIAKKSKLSDCIFREQGYGFDVLPAGFVAKNPLLYLSQPRLSKVIEFFKTRYERVVIECPPIMSVSDAYVISKHVDSIYLVVDAEKTNKADLTNVLEELKQAKVEVGGVIMNKARRSQGYYGHNYYRSSRSDFTGIKFA
ncbi:polysaccharide biosynthesis tyrosine autokinase [Psychrosphaera sp. 1_MG-2023]|uniref:GumC family protein n=1 Tax=Psychrosphaera sp. 1_MG-2023 TaxID=3062643 RepID=UPI0026E39634|nr:polysaccharide biosynthesis tyrosine autokinase [Psychrosphaera sp. 1_MG-2023]MDO6721349.1 polysaccharide biosynthesis tyrosine autokinase [Psychrosphaera sp. 1_MG-2023]